ncbi:MAG TPA: glycosyltransferase family 4 protein [Bacteroidia bacterium]|nr:glycosyltransferase family 4 protein [Bacteroidia bacterium]
MKILILTQYFPPETGAPQNRLFELAIRLKNKGAEIIVLTAMPNYPQLEIYKEFKRKFYAVEEMDGLKVHRSWIYVNKNKTVLSRLLIYFSFVFSSLITGMIKIGRTDYIICESPPLFLGITAFLLSRIKRSKMVFNVSDLWPESAEKLNIIRNKSLLAIASSLEEFLYRKSFFITGQTNGIVKNISERVPGKKVHWIPNGADFSFYHPDGHDSNWRQKNGFKGTDILFLYAGIMGHAQGLDIIISAAEKIKNNREVKFILLGEGPLKNDLLQMKNSKGLENVLFLDGVPKSQMPFIIKAVDAGIIPLKKIDLFLGAIPSKIFELLAMKKTILLGVDGEARELFIEEGKCGLFFAPGDADHLVEQIGVMINDIPGMKAMGERGCEYVRKNFNRNEIAEYLWQQLQQKK